MASRRIPANLITGFLGSGKTTAILNLLERRPTGERWSVFVNEYGMVSIDQALLEHPQENVKIQELAGGCMCCTMSMVMEPMLKIFLHRSKPDRLLIEPSGASHPAALLDQLRGAGFQEKLALGATICLVDPDNFRNPRIRESETFIDQLEMADVVAINWTDKRPPELIAECRAWLEQLDPPKLLITETAHGIIDPAWLDLDATVYRPPRFAAAHAHAPPHAIASEQEHLHHHDHDHDSDHQGMAQGNLPLNAEVVELEQAPTPGRPVRLENSGLGQSACGWIFSPEEEFDRDQILDLIGYVHPVLRVKGVFRCADDWWSINRVGDQTSYRPSAYRRDSRLEIITDHPVEDWTGFEKSLLETRLLSDK